MTNNGMWFRRGAKVVLDLDGGRAGAGAQFEAPFAFEAPAPGSAVPGVVGTVASGIEIVSKVYDFFTSGGFKTQSFVGKYTPNPRPPGVVPKRCVLPLRFALYQEMPQLYPFAPKMDAVRIDSFLYNLEYEYDGRNLLLIRITPQEKGTSTLNKSKLEISFAAQELGLPEDPVAHMQFFIRGTYERWGFPSSTRYTIDGRLDVRADGSAKVMVNSDGNTVRVDPLGKGCDTLLPPVEVPKVPMPKPYELTVYFSPAGSAKLRPGDADKIQAWYLKTIPGAVRTKVETGQLKIYLDGYASTTGGSVANMKLSNARIRPVQAILQSLSGLPDSAFVKKGYGEWTAKTGNNVEASNERRVRMRIVDMT